MRGWKARNLPHIGPLDKTRLKRLSPLIPKKIQEKLKTNAEKKKRPNSSGSPDIKLEYVKLKKAPAALVDDMGYEEPRYNEKN
jgi:hypothetical protein